MYRIIIVFLCVLFINIAQAQQVVFKNIVTNKVVVVKPGTKMFIGYKGYNGMQEFASNTVTDITDSTITLGFDMGYWFPNQKSKASTNNYKIIHLKDITHFRKRSLGGDLTKNLLQIGAAVGTFFLLTDLYKSTSICSSNSFLISFVVGISLNLATKLVFPENAKNQMNNGWVINPK